MRPEYDVVVVGAGPYGLSAAAHLRARGMCVAVFGRPLEMWREHMPRGMRLRSHRWAVNLSDPRGRYTFDRFCAEVQTDPSYPPPIETFERYGLWFQQQAVPDVDETYVSDIERHESGFRVVLVDGRQADSRAVVMATGLKDYAHRPAPYSDFPAELVSHSSDHRDFARWAGRRVVLIGAGQSAIEFAALLYEAGATVNLVSRHAINWLPPDRGDNPPLLQRLLAPDAAVAPGWIYWAWDRFPYAFHRFPQEWKDRYNASYGPGASDWLRDRVVGNVTLHERRAVTGLRAVGAELELSLTDGAALRADHLLLATGYRVDIHRLWMLSPSLRAAIRTDAGIPLLSSRFESNVPGLYFVGFTAVHAFGPVYRFVAGCGAAARRVAGAIASARVRDARPAPSRGGRGAPTRPQRPEARRLEANRAG